MAWCDLCFCKFRGLFSSANFYYIFEKNFFCFICSIPLLRNNNLVCIRCLFLSSMSLIFSLASYPVFFSPILLLVVSKGPCHCISGVSSFFFASFNVLHFCNGFIMFSFWFHFFLMCIFHLSFASLFLSSFWYFIVSVSHNCHNLLDLGVTCPFFSSLDKEMTRQEIHVNSQHSSFVWWFCTSFILLSCV